MLVYGRNDEVIWASDGQRKLMPCSDYVSETYSSLFWKVLDAGMVGNKLAFNDPSGWLEAAIKTRKNSPNLDFINTYSWGRMLISQIILDNGISIQARLDITKSGIDSIIGHDGAGFGVSLALNIINDREKYQSVLNSLSISLALVGKSAQVIYKNSSFSDLLDVGDHVRIDEIGCIYAADPYDDMVLRQVIENAAVGAVDSMILPLRSRTAPVLAAVSAGSIPGTAVVAISRFGEDAASLCNSIRQAFGISPAEAETMVGIGLGRSVSQIANQRNGAEKTVYNQIHRVRESLRRSKFAVDDLVGIARLVTKISAISRPPGQQR
ncbi:hypothetical protein ABNQ39_11365 [Azospirillum sp. A26]|uniref:helix-turn-helix transcriptional regulator n=1 Tax=Azospirillum sp. A26 TaxID=3160607 RepID=UPI00366FEAB5